MRGLLSALVLVLSVSGVRGEDWPQWGGHSDRNMVARAKNLPCCFVPGKKCSGGTKIDLKTSRNVRWVARLGSQTYSSPAVAGGKLFIGTNDFDLDDPRFHSTGGGQVLALDMASGRLLWRLVVPKLESKQKSSQFDEMELGVCSTPTVEGNRVYVVTNRCEVLALDVNGRADANIIWRYDIIQQHKVWPHDAANCSVLICGDLLYVGTANGVDGEKCPSPLAPALIVLDKKSGRLAAYDDEKIGTRVFHGQWSSPSLGKVGGEGPGLFRRRRRRLLRLRGPGPRAREARAAEEGLVLRLQPAGVSRPQRQAHRLLGRRPPQAPGQLRRRLLRRSQRDHRHARVPPQPRLRGRGPGPAARPRPGHAPLHRRHPDRRHLPQRPPLVLRQARPQPLDRLDCRRPALRGRPARPHPLPGRGDTASATGCRTWEARSGARRWWPTASSSSARGRRFACWRPARVPSCWPRSASEAPFGPRPRSPPTRCSSPPSGISGPFKARSRPVCLRQSKDRRGMKCHSLER